MAMFLPPATFGRWLLTQAGRKDWLGALARAAAADVSFPVEGSLAATRAYLERDPEDYDMVADVVKEWVSFKLRGYDDG